MRLRRNFSLRTDHIDQLPRTAQSLEMIQKNNGLKERPAVCIHLGNLPIGSIGNSQLQHSRH